MTLADKIAIVTGAGGCIGRAVCEKLASQGAGVAAVDVDLDAARETANAISKTSGRAIALQVDVQNRDEIRRMADNVIKHFGQIDILVNNAGGSARQENALFFEQRDEVIDRVLGVNLMGPIFCIRAVIGHMIQRRQGCIVNIGSIAGVQGLEKLVDYSAAKGGVIAMTRSLAKEVGPYGIRVNCVSPGIVPRPGVTKDPTKISYLTRVCTSEDVAELIVFLTTETAGYITGQNYIIDGGRSLGMKGN